MGALEISQIRKEYGILQVLKGVDIALDDGGFLVLLGSSGCGKSTLLSIIAGLAEPTSGDVLLDGKSIVGVHPKDRDIAMVFQSYALYPNLSVARNIAFPLEMRKVPRADQERAVAEVAKLLRIESLLDRKPAQLSGGQRQRVAIGRALVRKPKLFLFDEPLSNLDARLRSEMRHEIKRLHGILGTTIVYVTHDQVEAMTLATQLVLMHNGQVEQQGSPSQIYDRPRTMRVADFVGSPPMNFISGKVSNGRFRGETCPIEFDYKGPDGACEIVMGIRPEAIGVAISGQASAIEIAADVNLVELTGPEQLISTRVGGQELVLTAPSGVDVSPGQSIRLSIAPESLHFFEASQGMRL
ncbi:MULTISPECIES: ABC transporter ATP-binding protein [Sinorhizobium]|uniref:ABC transporter ATP-binding protein n=1 Tax=Sinorhizobium TaxID=28105 RepID=UPI0004B55925|nr:MULTISPECIES: ABC transporter ATP-binding protein [Sinorhizobium]ASY60654.1 Maltose/maltodextrin transport ATP-binding protein MalK [Sinorhizobium sp. CCBAU 05631]ASY74172.1 Maltose/maltodextrin transport ATP-binding protein MalK [Sinorhizobium fredii CCBAU 83666]